MLATTAASPFPFSLFPFPVSTRTAPPQPAPVSRAPHAPARLAAATTVSSSGALHSYKRRHDSCDSYNSSPKRSTRPPATSSPPHPRRPRSPPPSTPPSPPPSPHPHPPPP